MSNPQEQIELIVKENFDTQENKTAYCFINKKSGANVFLVNKINENKFFAFLKKTHLDSIVPFDFSFRNSDNYELFKLKKRFSTGRMIVEILDTKNNTLAFLTQPFITWKTKLLVRDIHGKIIAKASGNLFKWNFNIYDANKNILAEFYKIKGNLSEELLLSTGNYSLKIFNNNFKNKLFEKIIPAIVICIDIFYRKLQ